MPRHLLAGTLVATLSLAALNYTATIEQWRHEREKSLKAGDGWLSLAGLFWLQKGPNAIGSAPDSTAILARGPARVGVIDYENGKATFRPEPGVHVTVNGKTPAGPVILRSDANQQKPDLVTAGDFTFFVIHRGARDAVRVKDVHSEAREKFAGLQYYPAREQYHIAAKWHPYAKPLTVRVPNILGEEDIDQSPGYVTFSLNGKDLRLDPVYEDGDLFFIFKDLTAGKETYPSGRFLHAPIPKGDTVDLDFNKAYNPPCAFTNYATCPLPPKQNRLPVRIEAGELKYGHH